MYMEKRFSRVNDTSVANSTPFNHIRFNNDTVLISGDLELLQNEEGNEMVLNIIVACNPWTKHLLISKKPRNNLKLFVETEVKEKVNEYNIWEVG